MKTMMLATASAIMFASAASAGELVRLADTQMDNVTAGAVIAIAAGVQAGRGRGTANNNGAPASGKYKAEGTYKATSKTTIGSGTTPAVSTNDEASAVQTQTAEAAGQNTASARGFQIAGAALVILP